MNKTQARGTAPKLDSVNDFNRARNFSAHLNLDGNLHPAPGRRNFHWLPAGLHQIRHHLRCKPTVGDFGLPANLVREFHRIHFSQPWNFLPQFMCQKNPVFTPFLLVISTSCEKSVESSARRRRNRFRDSSFAKVEAVTEALLRHRPLRDLHEAVGTKPFGKGALDFPGVELDVNASRMNPFIKRQPQRGVGEPALGNVIHA